MKPLNSSFFIGCSFHGYTSFNGRRFGSTLDFRNAIFYRAPHFRDATLSEDTMFTDISRFRDVVSKYVAVRSPIYDDEHPWAMPTKNEYFLEACQSYRILRFAMKAQEAHEEEAMFWELEMRAKKRSMKVTDPKNWLGWVSFWLYEKCSRYGNSFGRPLFLWVVLLLSFVGLYLWGLLNQQNGYFDDPYDGCIWQPYEHGKVIKMVDFSVQQMIRPFGIWNEPNEKLGREFGLTTVPSTGVSNKILIIRLVATIQSISSIGLLILAGFALRRKFRMA